MSTLVFDAPPPPSPAPLLPLLPPAYIDVRETSNPPYLPPRFFGNWSLVAFGDLIKVSGIQGTQLYVSKVMTSLV